MRQYSSLLFSSVLIVTFFSASSLYSEDGPTALNPASVQQTSVGKSPEREQALPPLGEQAETLLKEAREFLTLGQVEEVEKRLDEALVLGDRLDSVNEIRRIVGEINTEILFSKKLSGSSLNYTVQAGDSLAKIAKKFSTNIGLIMRSNGLKNSLIRVEQKLKVSTATYSILVDKSDRTLTLLSDGKFFKQYSAAIGQPETPTPAGSFSIENRLENPTWFHKGKVLPHGDPENILGSRWLGFSLPGYGIHGTTLPESIGKDTTSGCIRMHDSNVEELYDIVPLKTWVTVTD